MSTEAEFKSNTYIWFMSFFRLALLSLLFTCTKFSHTFGQQSDSSLQRKLASYTDQYLENEKGIGLLVSVIHEGIDWHYGVGLSQLDPPKSSEPGMVFRAASISKLFCATAILQLVEQNVIKLTDPINAWLPEKFTEAFVRGNSISIHDLLQHTSGIYEPQGKFIDPINDTTDYSSLLLERIPQMEQSYPYGNHFYSNANYNLLAHIVQAASGMCYGHYVEQHIIKPLQLEDTYVMTLPAEKRFHGFIQSVFVEKYKNVTPIYWLDASDMNATWAIGAADISSSTADLVWFYKALHNGKILSRQSVALMTKEVVPARHPSDYYGYGTMVFSRFEGHHFYGHLGTAAGYKTLLLREPGTDIYIAMVVNVHGYANDKIQQFALGMLDIIND